MKVLSTADQISAELIRLIKQCFQMKIAVAWAGTEFKAFNSLLEGRQKIVKMTVGTHFYQTAPAFIESFMIQL